MVESDNNEDIGYHDLLFNSAVACILLFIIFSVKVGGNAVSSAAGEANGKMSSAYSIIPSEKVGEMITLRMVSISGLSEVSVKRLKEKIKDNDTVANWIYNSEPLADSPIPMEQVYFNGNTAVFSVALAKLNSPNVDFVLDRDAISNNLGLVSAKGLIIEGASSFLKRDKFSGLVESNPKEVNPGNVRVSFQVTGPSSLENSIIIR